MTLAPVPSPVSSSEIARRYLEAQLAGDRRAALRVVDEGRAAGLEVSDIHLRVVQPAQREVGRLWQENRITVAQEHLATSISQLVLARLYPDLPREAANGKSAIVACVDGEHHDLGARIGADFLEMAGFDVRLLGANVPLKSLLQMVTEVRPHVVGLSASLTYHVPALELAVRGLRELPIAPFNVVVGGHVLEVEPDLGERLGVDVVGTDAGAMVAHVRRILSC